MSVFKPGDRVRYKLKSDPTRDPFIYAPSMAGRLGTVKEGHHGNRVRLSFDGEEDRSHLWLACNLELAPSLIPEKPTRPRFEYKVRSDDEGPSAWGKATEMGAEGWELVAVVPIGHMSGNEYYFKRLLIEGD